MTIRLTVRATKTGNFNSHARVGRDLTAIDQLLHDNLDFNSHARVGRDRKSFYKTQAWRHFNSHARVGRDVGITDRAYIAYISTHTPV